MAIVIANQFLKQVKDFIITKTMNKMKSKKTTARNQTMKDTLMKTNLRKKEEFVQSKRFTLKCRLGGKRNSKLIIQLEE